MFSNLFYSHRKYKIYMCQYCIDLNLAEDLQTMITSKSTWSPYIVLTWKLE